MEEDEELKKIGKKEQFSQIKSKNLSKIIFIIILTSGLLGYFFFAIFY